MSFMPQNLTYLDGIPLSLLLCGDRFSSPVYVTSSSCNILMYIVNDNNFHTM